MDDGLNYLQTFNPGESKSELLEHTLIARKDLVDRLEELVIESANSGNKFQQLIIGPRGSGKTHVLKVLHNRIRFYNELKDRLEIAYLCEDEYGVATFLDWIIRILMSFIRWEPERANYLVDEIEKLKKVPKDEQEKVAAKILLHHIGEKSLLIVVENIGEIFNAIKKKGQQKFRDLIQQHPYFTIMASNQALFKDIQKEDMPFHNFFKIIHLKKLSLEEAIIFLKSVAEWDENSDLINFLNSPEGKGRINAIYDFTGGNHRLLVTFYQFLRTDYINKLSEIFIKTINDLTPYYQNMMRILSAQQQKIVQYLSQNRKPSTVKNIAENCFSKENTISKQMTNLTRLKYVDAIPSGRETFYEISEPLFRICNEVKENQTGPIKLFIDFLGNLYSADEIKKKDMCYFNLVSSKLALNRIKEAILQLDQALRLASAIKLKDEIIQCFQENHTTLFIHAAPENISTYLNEVFVLIKDFNYTDQFLKSIPQTIFDLLQQYDEIELERFEFIESYLNNNFKNNEQMIVPLKFLNIGIRHLKKKEKNALMQFTKEERATFTKFVLDRIKDKEV